MTRSILRHVRWTVTADTEPDAEPVLYGMQCAVCDATSGQGADRDTATAWAVAHSGRFPSHRTYRETVTLPYRTYPDGCP